MSDIMSVVQRPMPSTLKPNAKKNANATQAPARLDWLNAILVSVLVAGIIGSALSVAYQVNMTRQAFKQLQKAKAARDQLNVDWGRLLIEQQTFGATSQIGSRAVIYLHMYSPPANQTLTIDMPNAAAFDTQSNQQLAQQSSSQAGFEQSPQANQQTGTTIAQRSDETPTLAAQGVTP